MATLIPDLIPYHAPCRVQQEVGTHITVLQLQGYLVATEIEHPIVWLCVNDLSITMCGLREVTQSTEDLPSIVREKEEGTLYGPV